MLNKKTILITGSSGFIGSYLCKRLLNDYEGIRIVGIDNMNDYYDVALKEDRLRQIKDLNGDFHFVRGDLCDKDLLERLFEEYRFDIVVNLAAQAGVRYSIDNPDVYISSNIIGFYNLLEVIRNHMT